MIARCVVTALLIASAPSVAVARLLYPGYLDKDDAGTWTRSGGTYPVNSCTVKNGKLIVNGTLTAASSVTVNSAGALGGTGFVGGTNVVNGTLSLTDTGSEIVRNGVQAASTPAAGIVLVIR